MTEILQFPRNGPLIVEGFAAGGTAAQQHLRSRGRAAVVQTYITYRFHLRPAYVGIVAMGNAPPGRPVAPGFVDGVRVVSFFKSIWMV